MYEKAEQCYGYKIGDEITVAGEQYYVIADSPFKQDYVVALKSEPLTVAEVNLYGGVGTEDNHVNRYTQSNVGTAKDQNGYGVMAYYTSDTCGYLNGSLVRTGCTDEYDQSDIKIVVDNWSSTMISDNILVNIDGYYSRIISNSEIINNLQCISYDCTNSPYGWAYSTMYSYWTTRKSGNGTGMYKINNNGKLSYETIYNYYGGAVVRPVINVYKSAITKVNNN